jgi:XTP/dITP diphosphohydrolase
MKIVFASDNQHKLDEIRAITPHWIEIVSLKESGFTGELEESTGTIPGNALQKARQVYNQLLCPCFADDSGLEVNALGGKPGVDSAHFAGPERDSSKNIKKLLGELEGKNDRSARFVTVIAFKSDQIEQLFEGEIKGIIDATQSGTGGFGYDPVFIPEKHEISFALMAPELKYSMSHRTRAMQQFIGFLKVSRLN